MEASAPTFSVLTPVLNGISHLGECLKSVAAQSHPGIEHIVADGGSSDGSLQLLRAWPHVRVLLGPDRGIYDGINRALRSAHGEIIGILNADDCYAADVFNEVARIFENDSIMAVFGRAAVFAQGEPSERLISNAEPDPLFMATLGAPVINAWFFRRAVFEQLGPFSVRYAVAADREFLLRFAVSGLCYRAMPRLICRYRAHAASLTFAGNDAVWRAVLLEHHAITGEFLRRPNLSTRARQLLKRARSRDAVHGALYCATQGRLRELCTHAWAGLRHDPAWPMRFAAGAARRALRAREGFPT